MTVRRRTGADSAVASAAAAASVLLVAYASGGELHQPFPHVPPPPPGTCQWCGHCCGATKQVVPPWPPTFVMRESTVIMPCNGTGLFDPTSPVAGDFSKWAFASIDWSNGKDGPGVSHHRPSCLPIYHVYKVTLVSVVGLVKRASNGRRRWHG